MGCEDLELRISRRGGVGLGKAGCFPRLGGACLLLGAGVLDMFAAGRGEWLILPDGAVIMGGGNLRHPDGTQEE